jgi:hypothetical protein
VTTARDDLDQFLSGAADAFGGPPSSNRRRNGSDTILLIGSALSVVAVLGLGAVGIAMVHIVDSRRPVTAMPVLPPEVTAEAPGRAKASGPPRLPPQPGTLLQPPSPSIAEALSEAVVRAQFAAWWSAAHPSPKTHVHHPQRRHFSTAAGLSSPEPLTTPRAISGCPPSICQPVQ